MKSSAAAGNAAPVCFRSPLLRPADGSPWSFVILPAEASARLPSRGMVTVEGTLGGQPFRATLEPDGRKSHWFKVEPALQTAAGVRPGEEIALEISPVTTEPEPEVPADVHEALAAAEPRAREIWADITPAARRDWIQWIVSGKKAETRTKRIATACSMLAAGKRRPCCFDRSGFYSKGLSAPQAAPPQVPAAGG